MSQTGRAPILLPEPSGGDLAGWARALVAQLRPLLQQLQIDLTNPYEPPKVLDVADLASPLELQIKSGESDDDTYYVRLASDHTRFNSYRWIAGSELDSDLPWVVKAESGLGVWQVFGPVHSPIENIRSTGLEVNAPVDFKQEFQVSGPSATIDPDLGVQGQLVVAEDTTLGSDLIVVGDTLGVGLIRGVKSIGSLADIIYGAAGVLAGNIVNSGLGLQIESQRAYPSAPPTMGFYRRPGSAGYGNLFNVGDPLSGSARDLALNLGSLSWYVETAAGVGSPTANVTAFLEGAGDKVVGLAFTTRDNAVYRNCLIAHADGTIDFAYNTEVAGAPRHKMGNAGEIALLMHNRESSTTMETGDVVKIGSDGSGGAGVVLCALDDTEAFGVAYDPSGDLGDPGNIIWVIHKGLAQIKVDFGAVASNVAIGDFLRISQTGATAATAEASTTAPANFGAPLGSSISNIIGRAFEDKTGLTGVNLVLGSVNIGMPS